MNWEVFWSAFSAIATFAAVVVALWQSHEGNKRRLKVRINERTCVMRKDNRTVVKSITIDIFNTGNRTIEVKTLLLHQKHQKRTGLCVIFPGVTDEAVIELPCKLEPDESTTIALSHDWCRREFPKFLANKKEAILSRDDKISFVVRDSRGKGYRVKGKSTYAEFLIEGDSI
jgi:hypothetical protein